MGKAEVLLYAGFKSGVQPMTYILNTAAPGVAAAIAPEKGRPAQYPYPYQTPSKVSSGTLPTYSPEKQRERKAEEVAATEPV